MSELKDELMNKLKKNLQGKSFILNPDKKILNTLINGLIKNKEEYGEFYCPCRLVTGDKICDSKNICPCSNHEEEVEETGHCHCWLFVKKK